MIINSPYITGSINISGAVTGSLFGTASQATSASYSYTASSATNSTSASYALTASFALNAGGASGFPFTGSASITGSFRVSGSTNISASSYALQILGSGSSVFSVDGTVGRLFQVDDSLSGSLFSVNTTAGLPVIEAFSDNTVRIGQYNQKALFVSQSRVGVGMETPVTNLDVSGSVRVTNGLSLTGSLSSASPISASAILTTGTITAQTLVVQTITSSIDFVTGSTRFGSLLTNTHTFTGSVSITGSLTVNTTGTEFQVNNNGVVMGNLLTDSHSVTGSLSVTGSTAAFSNSQTTFNFNPQTSLLAGYNYLNFGGGSIMYRNATDIYIGSNSKYGPAGTTIANYTSIYGMGMITIDAGTLNYQANDTSVTAGTAYGMPIRLSIKGNGLVSINNVVASSSNYKLGVSGSAYINGTNDKGIFVTDNATYASIVGLNSAIAAYNPLELRASGTDYQLYLTTTGQVNVGSTQTTYPFYVQAALGNWTAVFDNTTSGASGILMRSTGGSQGFYYGAYDGGAYKFFVNGSGVVNSTSTSITIISSDIKLKTDIRDYDKGLAEVLAMKPRIYKRKDNLEIDEVGFIAQEMDIALAGSMIESYKDENEEPIHTYKLEWYPLLVKAIQELKAEIEELKNK